MFFHMLPLYSRIMFVGITALECLLAIMLLRWDAWKRYPVVSAYLTWQGVGGAANLLIALFGPMMAYVYVYYVVNTLLNLIAFAAALELYYKIFDPRLGLFAWGRRHVVIIMSVSLAIALLLGSLLAARNGGSLTRTMGTLNEIMSVALWATFTIILIYSRSLGFTWRPRAAGIAMGFILYRTVAVVCIFIAARLSFGAGLIANQVEMAAEFLAVAWWLGVFWGEEKFPQAVISAQVDEEFPRAAIPGQVEETPSQYGNSMETVARML
jgi:hypothetical protein